VLEKNPDEFYFGMVNKKGPSTMGKGANGTVNGDRGNQVLDQDAVRLFKTQDLGYVRTMRNKTQKEVDLLRQKVAGLESEGKKIVFVDDEEEQEEKVFDQEEREMEEEEREEQIERKNLRKAREKQLDKYDAMLQIAERRLKALTEAEDALDLTRKKMAKTVTVGGVTKKGVKFKIRERKR
jgi:U3 small nucleolar RNA-associated protein 11